MGTTSVGAREALGVIQARAASGSRPGRRDDGFRVALAIEGGGMRGTVSGGMALALHELGLVGAFDDVYGASAGAISGAWLVSSTPELLRGWADPSYAKMLIRPRNPLRRRPVVDLKTLVEVVYTQHAPMDFASVLASPVRWRPLATDVETGLAVDLSGYLREPADVQLAMRASAAMPLLAGGPVHLGGRRFFDAGVAEPVPYRTAAAQGATHILVLRSRRHVDVPRVSRAAPAFAATALRRHGPHFRRVFVSGSRRYLEDDALLDGRLGRDHRWPPTASIRPAPESPWVGRLASDQNVLEEAFEAGRSAVHGVFGSASRGGFA